MTKRERVDGPRELRATSFPFPALRRAYSALRCVVNAFFLESTARRTFASFVERGRDEEPRVTRTDFINAGLIRDLCRGQSIIVRPALVAKVRFPRR